jgi:hypothetical protein
MKDGGHKLGMGGRRLWSLRATQLFSRMIGRDVDSSAPSHLDSTSSNDERPGDRIEDAGQGWNK